MILTTLLASLALLTSSNCSESKEDDNLLIRALQKQQIDARSVIWDDPQNNWKDYQAVLVFSTWDYHTAKFNFFLQTLSEIEKQGIPLFNPLSTIRWNASKVYLKKLAEKGVKVIDSIYLASKDLKNLPNLLKKYGWEECVIKPSISASGDHTFRFNSSTVQKMQHHFKDYPYDLIIQPFMQEIMTEGEWSFIFFEEEFIHCVLKKPADGQFLVQSAHGGSVQPVTPPDWMINEVKKILFATEQPYLHARVDVIKKGSTLAVVEVEMIEPSLFLSYFPGSADKLAQKIKERLSASLTPLEPRAKGRASL